MCATSQGWRVKTRNERNGDVPVVMFHRSPLQVLSSLTEKWTGDCSVLSVILARASPATQPHDVV